MDHWAGSGGFDGAISGFFFVVSAVEVGDGEVDVMNPLPASFPLFSARLSSDEILLGGILAKGQSLSVSVASKFIFKNFDFSWFKSCYYLK